MKYRKCKKRNDTKRVYSWESGWASWNTGSLKLPEVRAKVRAALSCYRLKYIPVSTHKSADLSFYVASDEHPFISFHPEHKNAAIALHEAAHHICDSYFGRDLAEHCPEWLGIYLWLLEHDGVAPRVALDASAKAMGLQWAPRMEPKYVTRMKKAA